MADPEKRAENAYMASAWLGELIGDLDQRGLLVEGDVRTAVAEFLNRFRQMRFNDNPHEHWHADFYDLYVKLLGREP